MIADLRPRSPSFSSTGIRPVSDEGREWWHSLKGFDGQPSRTFMRRKTAECYFDAKAVQDLTVMCMSRRLQDSEQAVEWAAVNFYKPGEQTSGCRNRPQQTPVHLLWSIVHSSGSRI